MRFSLIFIFFVSFLLVACQNGHKSKQSKKQITIFHAGSVSSPLKKIIEEYKKTHQEVKFLTEAAGSVECARKITDLKKNCDIMISADTWVIEKNLMPDYCQWYIPFAGNEMALVYNDKSRKSDQISEDNWQQIIGDSEVRIGRSDPNSDPCGYRTLLCLQLAEKFYKIPGFYQHIQNKSFENIRPKETDLLALLECQAVDYIFLYKSVAIQHQLKYISLNDSINLRDSKLSSWYQQVSIEVNGKKKQEKQVKKGDAMVYGVCVLKNAVEDPTVSDFLSFFLTKGVEIFIQDGQTPVIPQEVPFYNQVPELYRKFVSRKK